MVELPRLFRRTPQLSCLGAALGSAIKKERLFYSMCHLPSSFKSLYSCHSNLESIRGSAWKERRFDSVYTFEATDADHTWYGLQTRLSFALAKLSMVSNTQYVVSSQLDLEQLAERL